MADLVPEFISVLRDIRDIKYPDIVTKHSDVVAKHSAVVSYDTLFQSYVATSSANANATALDKIATNADVVSTNADAVSTAQDAITCTEKALIASQVLAMTAEASTLIAGSPASASYNPTTGKMSFGIPTGPKGDKGDAFVVNAIGTLAGRTAYDLQPKDFTYYATDVGEIYFKLSATSGDWSVGSPFGKGDTGDTGNGIASIALTGTVGAVDTYRILFTDATFFDFDVTNGSVTSVAGRTGAVVLTKADVGLANVDNTSDVNKPVSTAQQTALDLKANQSTTYTKTETELEIYNRVRYDNDFINPSFEINQYEDIDTSPVSMVHDLYQIDRYRSVLNGVTGTIQRLAKSLVNGKYVNSVKCIAGSTASGYIGQHQRVEIFYNGETKSYGAWVKSNSINARLLLDDGVSYTSSTAHTGGGTYEFLSLPKTIDASATRLYAYAVISSDTLTAVSITTGDYIETTMWKLEDGSVSTKYKGRDEKIEAFLCRRSYRIIDITNVYVHAHLTTRARNILMINPMRATPAVSFSDTAINELIVDGDANLSGSYSVTGVANNEYSLRIDAVYVSGSLMSIGAIYRMNDTVTGNVYMILNAEI